MSIETTTPEVTSEHAHTAVTVASQVFGTMCTTNKKGERVSFERSIAFATKDARLKMLGEIYAVQVGNGVYGRIVADALAANVLTKSQGEIVSTMLASAGRNPSKAVTTAVVQIILAAWHDKTPKGQKAFYVSLCKELAVALSA